MPYTLSHAAAVLPFVRRRPLVASALVVGSMSPDLLYFLALEPGVDARTHTWLGLLVIDLPVALALLAVFHLLVVPALMALAPRWVRVRVRPRPPRLGVAAVGWIVLSVLIGGVTHLVWDAFTHHDGWVVLQYPRLFREWLWVGMPRYHFLQYLSSVVGGAVVLWYAFARLRRQEPVERVSPLYTPPARPWLVISAVVAAGVGLAVVRAVTVMAWMNHQSVVGFTKTLAAGVPPTDAQLAAGVARVSICVVTGMFVALVAFGAYQRARQRTAEPVD
ncbi:DUF4184 family protein [Actinokineospora globicatena]|uniref:DUF4184 family protein n=1 Tax=Actinokineospora globicatena TaxID=103729 RepID=A0A9W6QSF4_9PSEU|nr:DUF4184 family protein [Actinokineospora globicatena]MCP2305159.1 protein of unknown function (DUF4184) [Actinokineospora globicatena]GLW80628.1 hypothetical protein Aglo01_51090 [Actinokineospora globicatena]GLW87455.1 hypothetical protein Aglo02_50940 [Actinokineospora globicatena]GLW93824.1 hypothetical protein Aglo03_46400 [Actinokineospora globicatena]